MKIPSLVQGLVETEDGKVFELDSPKGFAWLESIGSFRFEPNGNSKPYTVRKESGVYWYGCRKVAGKVRKKYIGKSSEVTMVRLEEIANALEVASALPVNKATGAVAEVEQKVAEVAEVAEVAQDRLTVLELEVANLRKALEALQEALPGRLNSGDSAELPKVDNEVVEQLQNELGNSQLSESDYESFRLDEDLKRLLAQKYPLIPGHLWQEIEKLKERNRQLRLKIGEERRLSIEKISELEPQAENLMRRNQEKQAQLDELEIESLKPNTEVAEQLQNKLGNLRGENEKLRADYATLLESSTHVSNKLRQEVQELRSQLETECADREQVEAELAEVKQNSVIASKLPEAANLLNRLKANRKKSTASLADVETLLEIIEKSCDATPKGL
jgi:chromosome segregation ATPase